MLIPCLSRFIPIGIGIVALTSVSVRAVPSLTFEGEGDEFRASGTFGLSINAAETTSWNGLAELRLDNRSFDYHANWSANPSTGFFELDLFFHERTTYPSGSSVVFQHELRPGVFFQPFTGLHLTDETRFGEDVTFINNQGQAETVFSHGLVDTFLDWDGNQLTGHGTWTWERIPDSGSTLFLMVIGMVCCVAVRLTRDF
jgi:hypothetical protein